MRSDGWYGEALSLLLVVTRARVRTNDVKMENNDASQNNLFQVMPSAIQFFTFLICSLIFKFSLIFRHCFVRLWNTMPYSILHIDESLEKVVVVIP